MGKAIIIPSVDWGTKNLGRVTRLDGLVITGASTTHGEDVVLVSIYNGNPVTAQWSVTSNNATIVVSGSTCTVTPTGTAPAIITVQAAYAGGTATKTVSLVETKITGIDGQEWLDENAITLTAKNGASTVSDATFAITDGSDLATIADNGDGTATLTAKTTGTGGLVTITASKDGDIVTKQVRVYVMSGMLFHLDGADANFTTQKWAERKDPTHLTFNMTNVTQVTGGVRFNGSTSTVKKQYNVSSLNLSNGSTLEFAVKPLSADHYMRILVTYHKANPGVTCFYSSTNDDLVALYNVGIGRQQTSFAAHGSAQTAMTQSISALHNVCDGEELTLVTTDPLTQDSYAIWSVGCLNQVPEQTMNGDIYNIRVYGSNLSKAQMLNNQTIDAMRYGITLNTNS